MRNKIILSLILLLALPSVAWSFEYSDDQIADAIYLAEGGAKTRFPYGIKSIDTKGNKKYARKICLNSIRNARKRWEMANKPEDFIVFMGRRYSPPHINPNWARLVKYFLNKNNG